jgi:hypothetical protein
VLGEPTVWAQPLRLAACFLFKGHPGSLHSVAHFISVVPTLPQPDIGSQVLLGGGVLKCRLLGA